MESFDVFIYKKAKKFALRIINLYRYLRKEKHEYIMSKQIFRAGTSIGANIAESKYAQSNADLINKLAIARKEANETRYWLDLLFESESITSKAYESMHEDCEELIKILTTSVLKLQDNGTKDTTK